MDKIDYRAVHSEDGMKASDVIGALELLKDKIGNIPVYVFNNGEYKQVKSVFGHRNGHGETAFFIGV